jgi:hypothetical protein
VRTRAGAPLLLVLIAVAASPAHAQIYTTGTSFAISGSPGTTLVSQTNIPVSTPGELAVAFHGDSASGCDAHGLCSYSGRVVVHPGSAGTISVLKLVRHRRASYLATLFFGGDPQQPLTFAHVDRSASGHQVGLCADTGQQFPGPTFSTGSGSVTLSILQAGSSLLLTRCAGPFDGDVAGAAPQLTIPVRSLLRGNARLNLSGNRAFAAHGFAGTVSSTIVLTLGRPSTQKLSNSVSGFPKGVKTQRMRQVTESLSLVHAAGSLAAAVSGATDPDICQLLDSCGLHGTFALTPNLRGADAQLTATGPATRPYRDFLTALGLAQGGRASGIDVVGGIFSSKSGSVAEDLTQSGTCTDTAPFGPGGVNLIVQGSSVFSSYSEFSGTLRTRCPGPLLGTSSGTLASATFARRLLARRSFTIDLTPIRSFQDDGFFGSLSGRLSLTIHTHGRLSQHVFTEPVG